MRRWTESDLEALRGGYKSFTAKELAQKLGRSESSIWQMAGRLGLVSKPENRSYKRKLSYATKPSMALMATHKNHHNPFRGTSKHGNKWKAMHAGEYLGLFDTREDAARAYDRAIFDRFGDDALLNDPVYFEEHVRPEIEPEKDPTPDRDPWDIDETPDW